MLLKLIIVSNHTAIYLLLYTLYMFCVRFMQNGHNYNVCTALPLVKPRPPTATSIPAILKSLQDEWVCMSAHSV